MIKKRRIVLVSLLTVLLLVTSGCGLLTEKTTNEIDPPQEVNYLDEGETLDQSEENTDALAGGKDAPAGAAESSQRQVFLIDENGMVVPQVLQLPKSAEPAKQVIEHLVQDGKVSNLLPNGMRAVLPAGTEVLGLNINQGTATVDFSEQFKQYAPEDELRILQSLTYTLTQFDNINNVKVQINGVEQTVMPVSQTPIGDGLTRENGINIEMNGIVDVTNTDTVTVYFLSQNDKEKIYYVPVTRKVPATNNPVGATINELINGPSLQSGLLSEFLNTVELVSAPVIEDGVVTLNFNDAILGQNENTAISDAVLNALVLSLTEIDGIEKVALKVNGNTEVLDESGKILAEPVSRPANVNTVEF
ncbi:GerMN domain-containing protein [Alkalihalobacillus sp. AL-G]|uniref:GerMN domain-containing protein n=1 Tax=Alkalihalobacillus sp. AL-G TaxID=2926399 RepID=UPI00272BFB3F|nr:GerMN domain-containing protein [Alkalihalobacillus sp. AL-G]WLD92280.1 GerMN domain-containing protein [Alkalihalobacillus sp. AL-G]